MSKVRLSQQRRAALMRFAETVVRCPGEEKALASAYKACAAATRRLVEKKFPPEDMAFLKRYGVAGPLSTVKLALRSGGVDGFKFNSDDEAPLAPDRWESRNTPFLAEDRLTEMFAAWIKAVVALKKSRDGKLADYRALVSSVTTLDAVAEVWPEAAKFGTEWQMTALVALSPDVVGRIRRDVAQRAA